MPKLLQLKPREVEKILARLGFMFVRQKGSHRIFVRDNIGITVPFHNKPLKKGTLRHIVKATGISVEEFMNFL